MLLFRDRVGIALELISAGENIRAFHISGKSGWPSGTLFRTVSRACSWPNGDSNLRKHCDAYRFQRLGFAVELIVRAGAKNCEMNKCLSLVHLTSTIGSESSGSGPSRSWFLRCPTLDLDPSGTKSVSGRMTLIAEAPCSTLRLNFRAGN